jgi:phage repressor protein C with HTH and peptisase S24 domain
VGVGFLPRIKQFLFRGTPKTLSDDTRAALALYLGVDEAELEHNFALPREARKQGAVQQAPSPPEGPRSGRDDLVSIQEIDVRAAAGVGALNEDHPEVLATSRLPRTVLHQDLQVHESQVKLMSVRGDSMLPTLADGDRILVDTSHKLPSPPGIYVVFDGLGVVAKRVDAVPGEKKLRLHSDNPLYTPYDCSPDEVSVIGRVIWAAKRL